MSVKIRSMYDGERVGSDDVFCDPKSDAGKSKVKVAFANDSDINVIMKRALKSGVFPDGRIDEPMFGDFTELGDFHNLQNRLLDAYERFALLGADVRDRFNNNAGNLLDFLSNPANRDEAVKLGLLPEIKPAAAGAAAGGAAAGGSVGSPGGVAAPGSGAVPAPPSGGAA